MLLIVFNNFELSHLYPCFLIFKGYIAPAKIDPKLLDPKHIFKEVEPEGKKKVSILQVEVKVVSFSLKKLGTQFTSVVFYCIFPLPTS